MFNDCSELIQLYLTTTKHIGQKMIGFFKTWIHSVPWAEVKSYSMNIIYLRSYGCVLVPVWMSTLGDHIRWLSLGLLLAEE